jgi:hypothetical protein
MVDGQFARVLAGPDTSSIENPFAARRGARQRVRAVSSGLLFDPSSRYRTA